MAAEEGNGFQLRLTRAAPGEAEAWEAEQRQKRVEAIHTAAGELAFWLVSAARGLRTQPTAPPPSPPPQPRNHTPAQPDGHLSLPQALRR